MPAIENDIQDLRARVDVATFGDSSPVRTAQSSDEFLTKDEFRKKKGEYVQKLTADLDSEADASKADTLTKLIKFLDNDFLGARDDEDILNIDTRVLNTSFIQNGYKSEDFLKITEFLSDELTGANQGDINFLIYLTRSSMHFAETTAIAEKEVLAKVAIEAAENANRKVNELENEMKEAHKKAETKAQWHFFRLPARRTREVSLTALKLEEATTALNMAKDEKTNAEAKMKSASEEATEMKELVRKSAEARAALLAKPAMADGSSQQKGMNDGSNASENQRRGNEGEGEKADTVVNPGELNVPDRQVEKPMGEDDVVTKPNEQVAGNPMVVDEMDIETDKKKRPSDKVSLDLKEKEMSDQLAQNIQGILKTSSTLYANEFIFTRHLNYHRGLDEKLLNHFRITGYDDENSLFLKSLKESKDDLYTYLREYILNRYDNPFDPNYENLKVLKKASAIGVLNSYGSDQDTPSTHNFETCQQAVDFLSYLRDSSSDNPGYNFKSNFTQDLDEDAKKGFKKFKEHEIKILNASPGFKQFRDFEDGIKPILSFLPFAETALSALGHLFMTEEIKTVHHKSIKFRPSDQTTASLVNKISDLADKHSTKPRLIN